MKSVKAYITEPEVRKATASFKKTMTKLDIPYDEISIVSSLCKMLNTKSAIQLREMSRAYYMNETTRFRSFRESEIYDNAVHPADADYIGEVALRILWEAVDCMKGADDYSLLFKHVESTPIVADYYK